MNVRQTPEVEKRICQLWERFLLAGICNDLMLGEVEDHLFLEHIETSVDRTVVPGQPDAGLPMTSVMRCATFTMGKRKSFLIANWPPDGMGKR